MHAVASGAESGGVGDTERAAAIQRRLDALGISDREFESRSGVDRKALRRAANGDPVRPSTYTAVESWLTRLENEVGLGDLPDGFRYVGDPADRLISFDVPMGEGMASVVVKGPIENADLIREQAEKLIAQTLRMTAERRAREG